MKKYLATQILLFFLPALSATFCFDYVYASESWIDNLRFYRCGFSGMCVNALFEMVGFGPFVSSGLTIAVYFGVMIGICYRLYSGKEKGKVYFGFINFMVSAVGVLSGFFWMKTLALF